MRATMTTNVVVAVVLFATAGAHAQECTRKLIAMLKAWKIKSQFSRLDNLIFRTAKDSTSATITSSSGNSCRCSTCSRRSSASIGPRSDTSQYHAGSKPGSRRRRCRLSLAMRRCKSRWIDTALIPSDDHRKAMDQIAKDYSRRARERLANFHVPSV